MKLLTFLKALWRKEKPTHTYAWVSGIKSLGATKLFEWRGL